MVKENERTETYSQDERQPYPYLVTEYDGDGVTLDGDFIEHHAVPGEESFRKYEFEVQGLEDPLYVRAANENDARQFIHEEFERQANKISDNPVYQKEPVIETCKEVELSYDEQKRFDAELATAILSGNYEAPKAMEDDLMVLKGINDIEHDARTENIEYLLPEISYEDRERLLQGNKLEDTRRDTAIAFMNHLSRDTKGYTAENPIDKEQAGLGRLEALNYLSGKQLNDILYDDNAIYNEDYVYLPKHIEDEISRPSLGAVRISVEGREEEETIIPMQDIPVENRLSYISAIEKVPGGRTDYMKDALQLGSAAADKEIFSKLQERVPANSERIETLREDLTALEEDEYDNHVSHFDDIVAKQKELRELSDAEENLLDLVSDVPEIKSEIESLIPEREYEQEPKAFVLRYSIEEREDFDGTTWDEDVLDGRLVQQGDGRYELDDSFDPSAPKYDNFRTYSSMGEEIMAETEKDAYVAARDFDAFREPDFDHGGGRRSPQIHQVAPSRNDERQLQADLEDAIEAGESVRPKTMEGQEKALQMICRADMENHDPEKFQEAGNNIAKDYLDTIADKTQGNTRDQLEERYDWRNRPDIKYLQEDKAIGITVEDEEFKMPLGAVSAEDRLSYITAAQKIEHTGWTESPLTFLSAARTDADIIPTIKSAMKDGDSRINDLIYDLVEDSPEIVEALDRPDEPERESSPLEDQLDEVYR